MKKTEIRKEIISLTDLASTTFAKRLRVSEETGEYIQDLLEKLPEVQQYYETLRQQRIAKNEK